jgi:hypothetical protein
LLAALLMVGIFWKLYEWAPLSDLSSDFLPQNRILGLFLAALAILASHLFLQVPLAVISVLLTPEQEWEITPAFATAKIRESFTLLGWKVDKIIPESDHATSQIP